MSIVKFTALVILLHVEEYLEPHILAVGIGLQLRVLELTNLDFQL